MTDRWPTKFLLIPAVLLFLLVSILPPVWMLGKFVYGCIQSSQITENVLLSSRQMVLLGRSLKVAGLSTLVSLLLGLPVAVILAFVFLPLRRLCWLMTLMPLLIPPYIMAGAWVHVLSPNGFVNQFIMTKLGFTTGLSIFNIYGCVWCLGISFFPIVALIVATAIVNLDRSVLEIAKMNTNGWDVFLYRFTQSGTVSQ
jgi:iron(III) transport system permease protein